MLSKINAAVLKEGIHIMYFLCSIYVNCNSILTLNSSCSCIPEHMDQNKNLSDGTDFDKTAL